MLTVISELESMLWARPMAQMVRSQPLDEELLRIRNLSRVPIGSLTVKSVTEEAST